MMKELNGVNKDVLEKADAMAFEWAARAHAFYDESDIIDSQAAEYCKSVEDAQECESRANVIREILAKSCRSVLSQKEIEIIKSAAFERDLLNMKLPKVPIIQDMYKRFLKANE